MVRIRLRRVGSKAQPSYRIVIANKEAARDGAFIEIVGFYTPLRKSVDRSQFIFHYDYLNESIPEERRDKIGWIMARIDDPGKSGDISAKIDQDARYLKSDLRRDPSLNCAKAEHLDGDVRRGARHLHADWTKVQGPDADSGHGQYCGEQGRKNDASAPCRVRRRQ